MKLVRNILCLVLMFFLLAPSPARADDHMSTYMIGSGLRLMDSGTIKEVLKSDMIMLDSNKRYRLDNIRIPPYEDTAALEELKHAFLGKQVKVYTYHPADTLFDRYGVPFVHVVTEDGGTWIQDYMVAHGLAWAYSTSTSTQMVGLLKRTEEKAREGQIGFWKDAAYAIKDPDTVKDYIDSFQIVEGKIQSVAVRNGGVLFNFGKDWKTDFTIMVVPNLEVVMASDFGEQGALNKDQSPANWKGRYVRIRGWVRENHGPFMEVTHKEQFDIIRDPQ